MSKVTQAVITAAGYGTRFFPVVKSTPKEMLPIGNKPILQYVVEECIEAELEEIIIVVRKGNGDIIKDYFSNPLEDAKDLMQMQGKEKRYESIAKVLEYKNKIRIIEQDPKLPYGNGTPFLCAKKYLKKDKPFVGMFADDLVLPKKKSSISQLIDFFEDHSEAEGVMAVERVPDEEVCKYAALKVNEEKSNDNFGITEYMVEKPDPGTEPSNLISYGRFIIPFRVFEYLKADSIGKDGEIWLQDANASLCKQGKYFYKVIEGKWMTTGDPFRYLKAQIEYGVESEDYGQEIKNYIKKII